jgi:hypothetical protein
MISTGISGNTRNLITSTSFRVEITWAEWLGWNRVWAARWIFWICDETRPEWAGPEKRWGGKWRWEWRRFEIENVFEHLVGDEEFGNFVSYGGKKLMEVQRIISFLVMRDVILSGSGIGIMRWSVDLDSDINICRRWSLKRSLSYGNSWWLRWDSDVWMMYWAFWSQVEFSQDGKKLRRCSVVWFLACFLTLVSVPGTFPPSEKNASNEPSPDWRRCEIIVSCGR